ncbi:MAG: peptidoglycan-binding domain-containing protein [Gammaproteobacteria bacterium]
MKKVVIVGLTLASILAGPAVFADEAAKAPAATSQSAPAKPEMKKEQKKEHKDAKKKTRMSAEVKALQEALNAHGAKLKADGMWGKNTRAALKAYQKKNGLKVTGHADKATRAKLGMK